MIARLPTRSAKPWAAATVSSEVSRATTISTRRITGTRAEEVEAEDAVGARQPGGELGDRDRRGIRRDQRVLRDDPGDLAEDGRLQVGVLGHPLDHQVGVGDALETGPPPQDGGSINAHLRSSS